MPALLRVVGEAGIGKTYLLDGLAEALRADGWLVLESACHEIQRNTPYVVTNRLVAAAIRSLGAEAQRYTGGLEEALAAFDRSLALLLRVESSTTLDSTRYQEVFARFFDGVGADRKLALLCDDAQWIDPQSREMLDALAARYLVGPLAIVRAERVTAAVAASVNGAGTIALRSRSDAEAQALLRERFPDLPELLVRTIVDHAAGNTFSLLTFAEEAQAGFAPGASDEASAQRMIAARVQRLSAPEREFLQFCALLGEPLEYRVLFARVGSPEKLTALFSTVGQPYFVADGPGLRFRHAIVAEALRATVETEALLRREIIAVLQGLEQRELFDYERIAEHARALGDPELAYDAYVAEAELAFARRAWDAATGAYERALAIREPRSDALVRFWTGYVASLRSVNRDEEVVALLDAALERARVEGVTEGIGRLVQLLMATLWALDQTDAALERRERWFPHLSSDAERSEVVASVLFVAANRWDEALFSRAAVELAALQSANDRAPILAQLADAIRASGAGDYVAAQRLIERAIASTPEALSRQSDLLPFTALLIDFRDAGVGVAEERLPELLRRTRLGNHNIFAGVYFQACAAFARGDWERTLELVEEAARIREPAAVAAALFALPAAIEALTGQPGIWHDRIRSTVEEALRERRAEGVLLVAPWLALASDDRVLHDHLRERADALLRSPRVTALAFSPLACALAAHKRNDRAFLERLVAHDALDDRCRWAGAHWELAKGVARQALGDPSAATVLQGAAEAFDHLGAAFYSAYAGHRAGVPSSAQRELLERLGVVAKTAKAPRKSDAGQLGLTPREYEVARTVAEGRTNRQVAVELFLSERTVEVHLSNIFRKLSLDSRTMLVRWFVERQLATAATP